MRCTDLRLVTDTERRLDALLRYADWLTERSHELLRMAQVLEADVSWFTLAYRVNARSPRALASLRSYAHNRALNLYRAPAHPTERPPDRAPTHSA